MKILMVLDEEFPPDVRVEKEMSTLVRKGHEVHLLCYTMSDQPQHEEMEGFTVFRVPITRLTYKFKALALMFPTYFLFWKKSIQHRLASESYDIIHFHDLNLLRVALEVAKERSIPVIGDYHENRPEIMRYYHHVRTFPGNWLISVNKWKRFEARFTRHLDHLILVTEEARSYYCDQYGMDMDKITVVENYPEPAPLLKQPVKKEIIQKYEGRKMFLYFGDTGMRRGTGTILETARMLKDDPGYCFVIIGTSKEQKTLEKIQTRYGLSNVELTGFLSLPNAASYFRAAYAGLSPLLRNLHHDTTYANKVFQYMTFGIPAIVSDCPAQERVILEADCGLVHKANDAADLASAIRQLDDQALHDRLGANGAEAVKIKYNFTAAGNRLLQLYDRIADEMERDQQA
jgi:glycosyltransferase involved in cell wall biosynthesis